MVFDSLVVHGRTPVVVVVSGLGIETGHRSYVVYPVAAVGVVAVGVVVALALVVAVVVVVEEMHSS